MVFFPASRLFLNFITNNPIITSRIAPTAAPTPIPACTPLLSPSELDPSSAAEISDVDLVEVDVMLAEPVVDNVTGPMLEDDISGRRVAASANVLELSVQQSGSPQHQLFSPHLRTGAFSSCHYTCKCDQHGSIGQETLLYFWRKLTAPKVQTCGKQYSLCHDESVQLPLHQSFSSPSKFKHKPFGSQRSSATCKWPTAW
jgi:hypothetical protein